MKKMIGLLSLSGTLVACGGFSGDGSLYLTNPQIQTEYYTVSPSGLRTYIGCDFVEGQPQSTAVRMHFGFSGTLSELDMEWRGVTTSQYDQRRLFGANEIKTDTDGRYYVTFAADTLSRPTPLAAQPLGIIVSPSFEPQQVSRLGKQIGAFYARATGVAASGSATASLNSSSINVYQDCYFY